MSHYNHYDIPIIEKDTGPYLSQSAASLFYRLLWKNWIVFGEAGLTVPNTPKVGKALITGCMGSLSRYIDLSGALYYYGGGLYTPYGNAFKRYVTDHANERGGYFCLQLTPLPSWQLVTSGHFFATLSRKPQLARVSSGYRFIIRSNYTWSRTTILVLQYKLHKNPCNKPKEADLAATVAQSTQNSIKFKIDRKLAHDWWTTVEAPYTCYTFLGKTHHGYALAGTQKWKGSKWQFACKVIFFQTQNYATRLYFYLPSPLYSGTQFHPYYGNGMAITCLVCWRPMHSVRLEIQYSFIYSDLSKTKASQANRCPPSRSKHDATIQLLARF